MDSMGPEQSTGKGATVGLHNREQVRDQLYDCVFASVALATELPKYRFPEAMTQPRHCLSGHP